MQVIHVGPATPLLPGGGASEESVAFNYHFCRDRHKRSMASRPSRMCFALGVRIQIAEANVS